MTEGQKIFVVVALAGGAAYYLYKRKPVALSSADQRLVDQRGITAGSQTGLEVDMTGANTFASGAMAGLYDVANSYYSGQTDAGAAGVETGEYATLDNSRVFDPTTQEYDVYNAYHPNGEGPTLEGA